MDRSFFVCHMQMSYRIQHKSREPGLVNRHRVWASMAVLALLAATAGPAMAQDAVSPADSLRRAQDSVINAAWQQIELDSTKVDEYQKIITIYKSRKRHSEQLQAAMLMAAANPTSAVSLFALGDAHLDNGAPDLALDPLSRALAIERSFVRARVTLAEAYTMLRQIDSAVMHLDTAVQLNPRYAQAHTQRAALLAQLGRDSAAIESYRAAAELLPDSFGPWMRLCSALVKVHSYEEALEVVQYVTTLNADSPDALYLYAEINMKLARNEEAAHAFESFMLRYPTERRALEAERIMRELRGQ